MRDYIIRRLLLMIPTVILVTMIVFLSVRFIPGSVIDLMLATMLEEESESMNIEILEEALRDQLGLDVPIHVQYGRWVGLAPQEDGSFKGALQGDFGVSLWRQVPVTEEIVQRLPVSLELGIIAIVTGLIIALPLGIYSAIRQDTGGDYIGRTIAVLMISLPGFWIGTMVMVYPSIYLGWAPRMVYIPLVDNPPANLLQFLIPGVIMGMALSGTTMRMVRTMMLEVLRQDYIRTAWSKGLNERTIIIRHALKNALIPVVTIVGMRVPIMISGVVVIEQIFCLPGVGRLMIDALNKRDYPIISGINLLLAMFVLVLNLLIDLTYGYLDPRVVFK